MAGTAGTGSSLRVRDEHVPRRALADLLAGRFHHRLTVVRGGAGVGKSTALEQVESDNDVVLRCTPTDAEPDLLLRRILEAMGTAPPAAVSVRDVVAAMVLRSPAPVCLILDDVHRMAGPSVLGDLVQHLPRNGHLLLASRQEVPIALARLDADGQLLEISEEQLRFSPDEAAEFAKHRGLDPGHFANLDGWPAFLALADDSPTATRSRRYLGEEVAAGLDTSQRRALAILALNDVYDDAFIEAVTGWEGERLLGSLPLARRKDDGWLVHDLWGDLLVDELSPADRAAAVARAARYWTGRDEVEQALDLAAGHGHAAAYGAALLHACLRPPSGTVRAHDLERWMAIAPADVHGSAEFLLASGLLARERDPIGDQCLDLLQRSAAEFQRRGELQTEAEVQAHIGYPLYLRGDIDGLTMLVIRGHELRESGCEGMDSWFVFADAVMALQSGDHHELLRLMQSLQPGSVPAPWLGLRHFLMARSFIALGLPGEAIVHASYDGPMAVPGSDGPLGAALWYSGQPDRVLPASGAGQPFDYGEGARDRFLAAAYRAVACAFAGRADDAREALGVAAVAAGPAPSDIIRFRLDHSTLVARHVIGDDPDAPQRMQEIVDEHGVGHPAGEMLMLQVAWHYVTMPGLRSWLDALDLGPSHAQARQLARDLLALRTADADSDRDHADAVARDMVWPDPGVVAANLPVAWAGELAAAGLAAGRHEASALAAWLCEHWGRPARRALLAGSDQWPASAKPIRALLRTVPSPPDQYVRLLFLGRSDIEVDGVDASSALWRRERVRALALHLVLHTTVRREVVARDLWPDLDTEAAGQNLRTTLAYLNEVLEPGREKGDAPWFLRSDGETLSVDPSLRVDLWDFATALDDARSAEAAGDAPRAIGALERAVDLWHGPAGAGVDQPWADDACRDVDARFVTAANRLGQLRLAEGAFAAAVATGHKVVEADPWDERGHLLVVEAASAGGDDAAARLAMARLEERWNELGMPLSPRAEALRMGLGT